jgi:hypothetical protein
LVGRELSALLLPAVAVVTRFAVALFCRGFTGILSVGGAGPPAGLPVPLGLVLAFIRIRYEEVRLPYRLGTKPLVTFDEESRGNSDAC